MSKRRHRLAGQIAGYARNMSKKSRGGEVADEDDRRIERKVARTVKRLRPEEFDELLKSDGLDD